MTYDKLELPYGTYNVDDYKFLTKTPTLRHLMINGPIRYIDADANFHVSPEELLEHAPYVATFHISLVRNGIALSYPPIDMSKLLALNRQTKLTSFHLQDISLFNDPMLVVQFLIKYASLDVDYFFGFHTLNHDYDVDNVRQFYKTVNDGLRAWKLSLQIPPTISSSFIDLTGKIAVVRGASDGIGKSTVILFRKLGASVIAVARNRKQIKDLIDECQIIKNDGFLCTLSADSEDGLIKYEETLNYKFGSKCDILVNIADTLSEDIIPFYNWNDLEKRNVFQNFYAALQKSAPYLTKAKGCVINVTYPDCLITKPHDVKLIANFERKIKITELELASSGVRTNTVNSKAPLTALPRPYGMNGISYKKYLQESKKILEQQTANAIAYLASDAAKLIDGAVLPVNALNAY